MSGVLTESTADVGGTLDVGWIDNGDWMDYAINPSTSGTYTLSLRIATIYNTSQLQVKNGATVLATVNLPSTGGYQAWQTVSVTVNLTAGPQTLRIMSTSAQGFNINWLEIASANAVAGRIAAAPVREQMETTISTAAIYPNPVRDRFTMTLQNSFAGAMKIQVVNMAGVLQKQFSVNKPNNIMRTDLSIGELPKGEYLLLIDMNGKKETRKIIKL
jgi:endoglucanase